MWRIGCVDGNDVTTEICGNEDRRNEIAPHSHGWRSSQSNPRRYCEAWSEAYECIGLVSFAFCGAPGGATEALFGSIRTASTRCEEDSREAAIGFAKDDQIRQRSESLAPF